MTRRFLLWALSILAATSLVLARAPSARAASNDEDVELLVQSVLEGEYKNGQYKDALDKLELARQACEGKTSCSPKTRAKVYVALGTVLAGGFQRNGDAKEAFVVAIREDPTIGLVDDYITPDVQRAYNDARGVAKGSSGNDETQESGARTLKKRYRGGGRPPAGWRSAEAYFYYREAVLSERDREWLDCADYAQASLAAENRANTRFLAATCEERAGLWVEALSDYRVVSGSSGASADITSQAKQRSRALRERIPKIIIRKPPRAKNLVVKMNDDVVPPKKLGGEIWVNPGQRTITATGTIDGKNLEFEQSVDVAEFETATVDVKLAPKGTRGDTALMRCITNAKSRDDVAKCIGSTSPTVGSGSSGSGLNYRLSLEVSGYHDSDHVDVGSPVVSFNVESPTAGWGFGGSFLVDVVTTASTDILASASPRFSEIRYVPAVNGHKKFGDWDIGLHTSTSVEPDYLATGGGISAAVDLVQKTVTPSLSYDFGYDISGRSGTHFSTFSHVITRHGIDAGVGLVTDKATFVDLSGTLVLESGDSSKPYRYIPMFSPDLAPRIPTGFAIEAVNQYRLPERVLEQLPTNRQRYAIAGRIAHRFASSTIRAEERLYVDSWGTKATTTDSTYFVDVSPKVRVWPHGRLHAQTACSFWQRAYPAKRGGDDKLYVPALRTGDRELGPLVSGTLGGGARFAFGPGDNWGFTIAGDFVYSRFLDHLYILQRFGYFGETVFEMEFE